ncbi:MAG: D-2-hydroxyacid dehydrogenase [Gemmatimonadetes bacterium]|nr:D-2-hydroxyacid dehydrogenase [Gemmatimonadota bacterium]
MSHPAERRNARAAQTGGVGETVRVLIASYLEPAHVARIEAVDPRLDVVYEPDLIPSPRYAADHTGAPLNRTPEQEARWHALLADADVLFDFDRPLTPHLHELAPRVRWVQATSAGIGQFVKRHDLAHSMPHTVFTTASGVHARPLAEFCALAVLAFSRGLPHMMDAQRTRRWERFAGTDLEGKTLVIYGLGSIGQEVARTMRSFGMRILGIKRSVSRDDVASLGVDEIYPPEALRALLPRAHALVLCAPHTPDTEGILGEDELALLPEGAIFVNVARGALVDEAALTRALASGHLGGAALDVFAEEPLPSESPLWALPNVLVSPHSASTSDGENGRITDLFCENLRRFLAGEELLNVLDVERMY